MEKKTSGWGRCVLAIFFCMIVFMTCVKNHPYAVGGEFIEAFTPQDEGSESSAEGEAQPLKASEKISAIKSNYSDSLWGKASWLNLNGWMARKLGMQGYYSNLGIYVAYDDYILSASSKTATDYEVEQMIDFKSYLDAKGIRLLYVNAPTKYTDDNVFADNFGIESYSNRNADLFLQRIGEAGIDYIDLRKDLEAEGMNIYGMFYRTDHHWTTRSGLWATGKVAQALNTYCGYQISPELYQESNYSFKEYKNCWLGEQGRKLAESYVGLDDFTEIKPQFATDLILRYGDEVSQGSFDILVDETRYDIVKNVYENPSWHYSYLPRGVHGASIHNNNAAQGKVLVLGDSYSQVVVPFLSLGIADVNALVLRNYNGSVRQYIEANDFDTVVILYAQFMIGAHDNPASANYKMFTLE